MRSLLLISTITAVSAQAVFTDTDTLRAAVRDPSCCDNGEYEKDDDGNIISYTRLPSYNNSCTYNGVHISVHIKDWDVSQITDFSQLFRYKLYNNDGQLTRQDDCLQKFNADISSWDVSEGTNFRYMFTEAFAFNQDISGWRPTPNLPANRFSQMFDYAISFNQNLTDWNLEPSLIEGSTNNYQLFEMFSYTYSLYHLPTWFSENESYDENDARLSCALDPACGTCDQPKMQLFHDDFSYLFPEVMQTVTCNAGQLNPFDGADCKGQGCVDDNTLCCNPTCHTHESASECLAGASVCWWNLDTKVCANSCTLDWKNDKLRQCSNTHHFCGSDTADDNGVCKPACTTDGCVGIIGAYTDWKGCD